jgi:preprotein translocase subunit SecY
VGSFWSGKGGEVQPLTVSLIVGTLLLAIAVVVFFERAQRRIPIQYARRQVDRRIYGGEQAHLPLRVNMASMIPPIFASSLLMFPATLQSFNLPGMAQLSSLLNRGDWMFHVAYAALIVFFTFFYTAVTFQPVDVADNLKKQQANIPGIRPGRQTAEYIDSVISRITVGGALYLAIICILPTLVFQALRVPFQFGGTSLIIVVGTALETFNQLEAHLISKSYDGLTGPSVTRLSGRRPA